MAAIIWVILIWGKKKKKMKMKIVEGKLLLARGISFSKKIKIK